MKFFIDTADISEIRELAAAGFLDGVTTNPSLIAKTGRPIRDVIKEICHTIEGPVSAEVTAIHFDGMIAEFNIKHCSEGGGTGSPLDIEYSRDLGPTAVPSLQAQEEKAPATEAWGHTRDNLRERTARVRESTSNALHRATGTPARAGDSLAPAASAPSTQAAPTAPVDAGAPDAATPRGH